MSTLTLILVILACWFAVSVVVGLCVVRPNHLHDRNGGPR